MSDSHNHARPNSSIRVLVLVTVILLSLLYLLVKGCTSSPTHDAAPAAHGSVVNAALQQMVV